MANPTNTVELRRLLFHDRHIQLVDAMRLKPQIIKNPVKKPYMEDDKVIVGQYMPAIDFGIQYITSDYRKRCPWKVISGKKDFLTDSGMSSGRYSALELVKRHPSWTVLFISCRIAYKRTCTNLQ